MTLTAHSLGESVALPGAHLARIRGLVEAGGPTPAQYDEVHRWLEETDLLLSERRISREDLLNFWHVVGGDEFLADTMQGFALRKPYGYAGDFEIIDRIYREHISANPRLRRWDEFFHAQSAPRAVRNRKTFFHKKLAEIIGRRSGSIAVDVLNLGSGPCRDIAEFLDSQPTIPVVIDCVDQDQRAIDYAKALLDPLKALGIVHFFNSNVVRYKPQRDYDLIWSAGLFDYLPDRLFVTLLARLLPHVRKGGQAVVGNFRPGHSTKLYMELVGNWVLTYRTPEQMLQLAREAGVEDDRILITQEPEGVNLFLVINGQR